MIIRTYLCEECNQEFEVHCESGEDGDPDCPTCSKVLQWVPARLNMKTDRSRAIDYTQQVLEQDYGLSDINDNNREGDVAYKEPRKPTRSEIDTIEQSVREYVRETTRNVPVPVSAEASTGKPASAQALMLQPSGVFGAPPSGEIRTQTIATQAALAGAKIGPEAHVNPMEILQQGIKAGHIRNRTRIIGRWKP